MSKIKFLVFAFIFSIAISCGQQKRYITYKVQEGETMRDIANRLDMKTRDLLRLNPDIGRKPVPNTTIIIPNPKFKNTTSTNIGESVNENEDIADVIEENNAEISENPTDSIKVVRVTYDYITHTVQPKETVYALTKKYNLSKDELIKLNPEFPGIKNNVLSIGQVVKVKAIENKIELPLEEDLKNFVTHDVKPKETVYSITRFYNITKDELIALNPEYPGIKDNYLAFGTRLRIRAIEDKLSSDEKTFYEDIIDIDEPINITFLLPFKADSYANNNSKDIFESNRLANMVTDFYLGAEMALDSIKAQGIALNVSVYDTGNRDEKVSEILENNLLDDADVIVGPFYNDKAEEVAKSVGVPVMFPHYSKSQSSFSASKIVKTEADREIHAEYLANYLRETYDGQNVFVVGDDSEQSNKNVKTLVDELTKHDSITKVHVLKPKDNYIDKARFTDVMKEKSDNIVVIASSDRVVVADALNSMIVLPEEVTVQVFAVEKGSAYDKIDNNKLARVNFSFITSSYADENASYVKAFNKKYKAKNNTIPTEYAIKGFDITYDVLMRLASGKSLIDTFNEGVSIRLENKFDYDKKFFGSTTNKGLYIVKYNSDLSLTRLK